MWGVIMESADRLQVVVVPSGAVIVDGWGRSVMMFPAEKEADEYLEELRKEQERTDKGDSD